MTFLPHHTGLSRRLPILYWRSRAQLPCMGGVKLKLRHVPPEFLCSVPKRPFLCPDLFLRRRRVQSRSRIAAGDRRKAAQVLDGGEHGARLKTHEDLRFVDLTKPGNTTEGSSPWDADIASQPCIRWIRSFGSRTMMQAYASAAKLRGGRPNLLGRHSVHGSRRVTAASDRYRQFAADADERRNPLFLFLFELLMTQGAEPLLPAPRQV